MRAEEWSEYWAGNTGLARRFNDSIRSCFSSLRWRQNNISGSLLRQDVSATFTSLSAKVPIRRILFIPFSTPTYSTNLTHWRRSQWHNINTSSIDFGNNTYCISCITYPKIAWAVVPLSEHGHTEHKALALLFRCVAGAVLTALFPMLLNDRRFLSSH